MSYLQETWEEMYSELEVKIEKYKKALDLAIKQRNSYMFEEGRSGFIGVLNKSLMKKHNEEIDRILNAEVQDE